MEIIFIIITLTLTFIKSSKLIFSENIISETYIYDNVTNTCIEIQEFLDDNKKDNKDYFSSILIKIEKSTFKNFEITEVFNKKSKQDLDKEKLWKFEFISNITDFYEITYFDYIYFCLLGNNKNSFHLFKNNFLSQYRLHSVKIFYNITKELNPKFLINILDYLKNIEININEYNLYLSFSGYSIHDNIKSRIINNHPTKHTLIENYLLDGFQIFKNQIEVNNLNADNLYRGKSNIIMNLLEEDFNFEDNIYSIYINKIQSYLYIQSKRKFEINLNKKICYITNNLFKSLFLFSFYLSKNMELKNGFKDIFIEYRKDSEFSQILNEEYQDQRYYVSPVAIYRGVGMDLINKTDLIYNENELLLIKKTYDTVVFKNSKFLSTSLDINVAINYAKYKNCSNLIKFVGNKECHIPVNCFECRNESVKDEKEVLLYPNIYFILNNISLHSINSEDYIIIEMISFCGEYKDKKIISLF